MSDLGLSSTEVVGMIKATITPTLPPTTPAVLTNLFERLCAVWSSRPSFAEVVIILEAMDPSVRACYNNTAPKVSICMNVSHDSQREGNERYGCMHFLFIMYVSNMTRNYNV